MNINIGVIGLGYVGLPLSLKMGHFFNTVGYDFNKNHISLLKKQKKDKNNEVTKVDFSRAKKVSFTYNFNDLKECNIYIIALPTPVNKHNKPDISNIITLCKKLVKLINESDTIIFESSFYPGTVNDILVPAIEKKSNYKLICNKNFFVGYSPERINPGLNGKKIHQIKKIVSASNNKTLNMISDIYSKIIDQGVHKVKDIKVAEAAKMLENAQRDVNIGFINEYSILLKKLNIDVISTLRAAETKWNYHKYRPGLVGGHCIGVDTNYLIYASRKENFEPSILSSVRKTNENMSKYYADEIIKTLKLKNKQRLKSRVLIMGFAFKENCPDIRNTKIYDLYLNLLRYSSNIDICDNYVNANDVKKEYNISLKKKIKKNYYDAVVIAVAHDYIKKIKFSKIKEYTKKNSLVFDLKYTFFDKSIIYI